MPLLSWGFSLALNGMLLGSLLLLGGARPLPGSESEVGAGGQARAEARAASSPALSEEELAQLEALEGQPFALAEESPRSSASARGDTDSSFRERLRADTIEKIQSHLRQWRANPTARPLFADWGRTLLTVEWLLDPEMGPSHAGLISTYVGWLQRQRELQTQVQTLSLSDRLEVFRSEAAGRGVSNLNPMRATMAGYFTIGAGNAEAATRLFVAGLLDVQFAFTPTIQLAVELDRRGIRSVVFWEPPAQATRAHPTVVDLLSGQITPFQGEQIFHPEILLWAAVRTLGAEPAVAAEELRLTQPDRPSASTEELSPDAATPPGSWALPPAPSEAELARGAEAPTAQQRAMEPFHEAGPTRGGGDGEPRVGSSGQGSQGPSGSGADGPSGSGGSDSGAPRALRRLWPEPPGSPGGSRGAVPDGSGGGGSGGGGGPSTRPHWGTRAPHPTGRFTSPEVRRIFDRLPQISGFQERAPSTDESLFLSRLTGHDWTSADLAQPSPPLLAALAQTVEEYLQRAQVRASLFPSSIELVTAVNVLPTMERPGAQVLWQEILGPAFNSSRMERQLGFRAEFCAPVSGYSRNPVHFSFEGRSFLAPIGPYCAIHPDPSERQGLQAELGVSRNVRLRERMLEQFWRWRARTEEIESRMMRALARPLTSRQEWNDSDVEEYLRFLKEAIEHRHGLMEAHVHLGLAAPGREAFIELNRIHDRMVAELYRFYSRVARNPEAWLRGNSRAGVMGFASWPREKALSFLRVLNATAHVAPRLDTSGPLANRGELSASVICSPHCVQWARSVLHLANWVNEQTSMQLPFDPPELETDLVRLEALEREPIAGMTRAERDASYTFRDRVRSRVLELRSWITHGGLHLVRLQALNRLIDPRLLWMIKPVSDPEENILEVQVGGLTPANPTAPGLRSRPEGAQTPTSVVEEPQSRVPVLPGVFWGLVGLYHGQEIHALTVQERLARFLDSYMIDELFRSFEEQQGRVDRLIMEPLHVLQFPTAVRSEELRQVGFPLDTRAVLQRRFVGSPSGDLVSLGDLGVLRVGWEQVYPGTILPRGLQMQRMRLFDDPRLPQNMRRASVTLEDSWRRSRPIVDMIAQVHAAPLDREFLRLADGASWQDRMSQVLVATTMGHLRLLVDRDRVEVFAMHGSRDRWLPNQAPRVWDRGSSLVVSRQQDVAWSLRSDLKLIRHEWTPELALLRQKLLAMTEPR